MLFSWLVLLCILNSVFINRTAGERILGYKLLGEGNCQGGNTVTRKASSLQECSGYCTDQITCTRFVYEPGNLNKQCLLKTTSCEVDNSVGKYVYERIKTELMFPKIPELVDFDNSTCISLPLTNGTELRDGWLYSSVVEVYKSPEEIEKRPNDVLLDALFSDIQSGFGVCRTLEMFYTSFTHNNGDKNCTTVRQCTAIVLDETTENGLVDFRKCRYLCECPEPPCPLDLIPLDNQVRTAWKLCELQVYEGEPAGSPANTIR